MTESESVALPLGDAPISSTLDIIPQKAGFVKRFLKKIDLFLIILIGVDIRSEACARKYKRNPIWLPFWIAGDRVAGSQARLSKLARFRYHMLSR